MPTFDLRLPNTLAMARTAHRAPRDWSAAYVWWLCFLHARLIPAGLFLACVAGAAACTFALGYLCGWI
jgi:hypothetical protein